MAATRLLQAFTRLASRVVTAASDVASSRPARFVGGTVAVGAVSYQATEQALSETVPYGPDGGRRRGPDKLWATALGAAAAKAAGLPWRRGPATASFLTEVGYPEVERQLGSDGLSPVPAGEVQMHWLQPEGAARSDIQEVYSEPYRQAVEASMIALVAALRQEAEEKGFGKQVLEHGLHLIVIPRDCPGAESVPCDTIILPAGLIADCVAYTRKPNKEADLPAAMAALQFVMAHELAHLYLQHGDERAHWLMQSIGVGWYKRAMDWACPVPLVGAAVDRLNPARTSQEELIEDYQQDASEFQHLWWQHEFEADEVACALLARLRVPPEKWAAGFRVIEQSISWHGRLYLLTLLEQQQQLDAEQKRLIATAEGFPHGDYDAGMELVRAALATGNADAFQLLQFQFAANVARHKLQALADKKSSNGGSGQDGADDETVMVGRIPFPPDVVEGPKSCPEPAVHTFLADMIHTHPRFGPRITRINQLSGQLPMLLRATAPPVPIGGRYSHASVAEQVAQQLAAGLAAEAAAKAAEAAAQEAAAKAAAERATLAGSLMAGFAATAAALKAACNRPS